MVKANIQMEELEEFYKFLEQDTNKSSSNMTENKNHLWIHDRRGK